MFVLYDNGFRIINFIDSSEETEQFLKQFPQYYYVCYPTMKRWLDFKEQINNMTIIEWIKISEQLKNDLLS